MFYVLPVFSFHATPSERSNPFSPEFYAASEVRTTTRNDSTRQPGEADENNCDKKKVPMKLEHRLLRCYRGGESGRDSGVETNMNFRIVESRLSCSSPVSADLMGCPQIWRLDAGRRGLGSRDRRVLLQDRTKEESVGRNKDCDLGGSLVDEGSVEAGALGWKG